MPSIQNSGSMGYAYNHVQGAGVRDPLGTKRRLEDSSASYKTVYFLMFEICLQMLVKSTRVEGDKMERMDLDCILMKIAARCKLTTAAWPSPRLP